MSKTEALIEIVKKYLMLYDLKHDEYKNIRKKDKIWDEISKELNENVRKNLQQGFLIYENYQWLINSYVLDFFTENHWYKLPESWKSMKNITTNQLAELLEYEKQSKTLIFPLSILALKAIFQNLNLSRKIKDNIQPMINIENDQKLMKTFWKNVKLKKRHEIPIMAKLSYEMALQCKCFYVVDVGSGLGHLSRMLTYGYNLEMCTIEAEVEFIKQAGILDSQFDIIFQKKYGQRKRSRPVHMRIEPSVTSEEFLNIVCSAFDIRDENFEFGLVGLHPCGDLGPTLLRLYEKIPNIKYINIVGCCYMKLSTSKSSPSNPGFPLSKFCMENNNKLCYHSREIACHAIENYVFKLYEGEYWKLKIHAYRATIEKILTEMDPQYKHIPLASVKYVKNLEFKDYCEKATAKLLGPNAIDLTTIESGEVQDCLEQWNSVVIFYSFRLFFAPLIESLILYDRLLFLQEKGNEVNLIAGFDSKISPRMHVLQGSRFLAK